MSATFDVSLGDPVSRVRAAIGDRDVPDNALRSDEEIDATIALSGGDELLATAILAEGLAAEYAQRVDAYSESGGISVRWSERVKTWLAIASAARSQSATGSGAGESGGVSGVMVRVPSGALTGEYERCGSAWGRAWYTD